MHIAGGLYRERCYIPEWNALYGSGGRAALAVSALSPGSSLYTYIEDFDDENIHFFEKSGIEMRLKTRFSSIEFTYFHPLSRPLMQPAAQEILRQKPIHVSADAVLRFGFIEGDAIVDGNRVVYDPQTWKKPDAFSLNGSKANELAIVLNEAELEAISGISDLSSAGSKLLKSDNAAVVVVKRGFKGAMLFGKNGQTVSVPAYRSTRVFKIGTGDIFSAAFAYYWAEKRLPINEAADIASRLVAFYCNDGKLPLTGSRLSHLKPINYMSSGSVLLLGAINTIGQRYTMEEARFVLKELGAMVSCPALDGKKILESKAALIIAEGLDNKNINQIKIETTGLPVVILKQNNIQGIEELLMEGDAVVIDDFTSAIYLSAWAAIEAIIK
jgi:hypothetical protein